MRKISLDGFLQTNYIDVFAANELVKLGTPPNVAVASDVPEEETQLDCAIAEAGTTSGNRLGHSSSPHRTTGWGGQCSPCCCVRPLGPGDRDQRSPYLFWCRRSACRRRLGKRGLRYLLRANERQELSGLSLIRQINPTIP